LGHAFAAEFIGNKGANKIHELSTIGLTTVVWTGITALALKLGVGLCGSLLNFPEWQRSPLSPAQFQGKRSRPGSAASVAVADRQLSQGMGG
jgi:hypothetical protein